MEKLIILLLIVTACTNIPDRALNSEFYKRDMIIEINGETFSGVATPAKSDEYKIHVTSKGKLDLFTLETCHREVATEKAWNVTKKSKIFRRNRDIENEMELTFVPLEIEKEACPILLGGFESKKGRHSWAFIDAQDARPTLQAKLTCNGETVFNPTVSVCQAKKGLLQTIEFGVEVKAVCEDRCEKLKPVGKNFTFPVSPGRCACLFKANDGRLHRLTTIGYDRILMRE